MLLYEFENYCFQNALLPWLLSAKPPHIFPVPCWPQPTKSVTSGDHNLCLIHWVPNLLLLTKRYLKNSSNSERITRGFYHNFLFYVFLLRDFSASATSGGRYNKMTEVKTLSHIKMLYQQLPNPEHLENELMESTAVPLLSTGCVGSDWWFWT